MMNRFFNLIYRNQINITLGTLIIAGLFAMSGIMLKRSLNTCCNHSNIEKTYNANEKEEVIIEEVEESKKEDLFK